jgi:hypothetical protein
LVLAALAGVIGACWLQLRLLLLLLSPLLLRYIEHAAVGVAVAGVAVVAVVAVVAAVAAVVTVAAAAAAVFCLWMPVLPQGTHWGVSELTVAPDAVIRQAQAVLAACKGSPMYAHGHGWHAQLWHDVGRETGAV